MLNVLSGVGCGTMFYACLQAVWVQMQKPGQSLTDKKLCIDFPQCESLSLFF